MRYAQKHGSCSFNFSQHSAVGGTDDSNAGRHGLISIGLQFTASASPAPVMSATTITIAITGIDRQRLVEIETFFIFLVISKELWYLCISDKEKEKNGLIYRVVKLEDVHKSQNMSICV